MKDDVPESEEEWKQKLTSEQYEVLRKKGTEPAFSGAHYNTKEPGTYLCAACGQKLFLGGTKFDSGSGWPSFYQPIGEEVVREQQDDSHGMKRTEIICSRCGSHLGHVFDDGPKPTGQRYCINSLALNFEEESDSEGEGAKPKVWS